MRLNYLKLTNFKGARSFEINPGGADLNIYGDNAAGKTTTADAFYWLLFGKDSQNRSDFEIKTLGPDNQPIHNLDHSVEASVDTTRGTRTLKRTYHEVYTRQRGSATQEFSGHTTEYWVDGVPVQATEYRRAIDGFCNEKIFRLLTDPTCFCQSMAWQERRKLLLDACGDVSDESVIASNKELALLPEILGSYTLEQYRKILDARRKELNDELKSIPTRIDEATRSKAAVMPGDHKAEVLRLDVALNGLRERRAAANAGGEVAEHTKQLRQIEGQILDRANSLKAQPNPARTQALEDKSSLERGIRQDEEQVETLNRQIRNLTADRERIEAQKPPLRERYAAESQKQFDGSTNCPSCKQELPEDQVLAAVEAFNLAKSETIELINRQGAALKTQTDELDQTIEGKKQHLKETDDQLARRRTTLQNLVVPAEQSVDPSNDAIYQQLQKDKAAVEQKIATLRESAGTALESLDREISEAQEKHRVASGEVAKATANEATEKRILELTERQRELARLFEETEAQLFLCETFTRTKVSMLTSRINSRFRMVSFKLFDEQVNGGLSECCEATVNGVPYSSLNHGARVNAGLDIIHCLSAHIGFAPPIFIDNAESVTRLLATDGQQIRLVVSEADSQLRVEAAGKSDTRQPALV